MLYVPFYRNNIPGVNVTEFYVFLKRNSEHCKYPTQLVTAWNPSIDLSHIVKLKTNYVLKRQLTTQNTVILSSHKNNIKL